MPSHTLDADPDECAECRAEKPYHGADNPVPLARRIALSAPDHAAAQDAAIARAVRAAAGTDINPIAWLLGAAYAVPGVEADAILGRDHRKIAAALRREIGGAQ